MSKGGGRSVAEMKRLLKQFEASKQMMKQMCNLETTTVLPTKSPQKRAPVNPNRKKERHKKKKKR